MKTLQENLKLFYLGLENSEPYLYKNKDLTTHALIIGMTGSGKTGLGITLLEEAAIDNIPSIIIDPKGDLTNLALTFPNMSAQDFLPYIDETEAANKGLSVEQMASETAQMWRNGIENSYQNLDRVELLKNSAEFKIYTPKSSAGLGVSLLSDFEAPKNLNDEDMNNYICGIASSVLSLAGITSDNLSSPEFLLISQIFSSNFSEGRGVSVVDLINQIIIPPFDKIGVFDVNNFFPGDKRMALAIKINALIASPSFKLWCEGERLDIAKMLFNESGKARANIFCIAHLNDDERMFFVTLLLNEMVNWMRQTQGTSALRAILYMDEIYGFFPPNGNPPSKTPMLTLLKQARAFGLGCVLSTQNPVDLDYKGLSNIGTWFIGRLQTAQDKERVIGGLSGIGSNPVDKSELMEQISNLKKRNFLVKNINEDSLKTIETRFALSYLKGPLSNEQISNLMSEKKGTPGASGTGNKVKSASGAKPIVSNEISQIYSYGASRELSPYLYATAKVRYADKEGEYTRDYAYLLDISDASEINWDEASDRAIDNIRSDELEDSSYCALPSFIASAKNFATFIRNFKDWVYRNQRLELYSALDMHSTPDESKEEFYQRLQDKANEILEQKTDEILAKFEKEKSTLQTRINRAEEKLEKEKSDVTSQGINAALSIGSAILGSLFGRSRTSATTISKTVSGVRNAHRVLTQRNEAKNAEASVDELYSQMQALQERFDEQIAQLKESLDLKNIELGVVSLAPKKTDIYDEKISILWKS
ncbi:MAG: DUF87 domain-containing protein [Campylobacter sp.]|nr:DUF87 domain-containing protein [Campylobacter sp.]